MIIEDYCKNIDFILNIVAYIFKVMQWIVPILLIVLVSIDFAKGMIGGDEKKSKEALNKAGKRLLYAVILFLVPILVKFVFRELADKAPTDYGGEVTMTSWIECFSAALDRV